MGRRKSVSKSSEASSLPAPEVRAIRVYDCCGALGYLIPWAEWKASGILPTSYIGGDKAFVYLFSRKGQLGDERRALAVMPKVGEITHDVLPAIDLDEYILPDSLAIDWLAVKLAIVQAAKSDTYRKALEG